MHRKSEKEMVSLFKDKFEEIMKNPHIETKSQDEVEATAHFGKDLLSKCIDLNKEYKAIVYLLSASANKTI